MAAGSQGQRFLAVYPNYMQIDIISRKKVKLYLKAYKAPNDYCKIITR